jgi:predicted dithiol-disulfide oxidoreductase (DUF899 family)/catechol 2,3-dioxygenase-like lactoylglutathione lyase family enzyme
MIDKNKIENYKVSLQQQNQKINSEVNKIKELYKGFPLHEVQDYVFQNIIGERKLSAMFDDKDELMVVHNMGEACPYCALWADGFNGYYHHLKTRLAFVLINQDSPQDQHAFAISRNWKFPVFSARDNSFTEDMGYANAKDKSLEPGLSVFKKSKDGKIFRTNTVTFGPTDLYCSFWNVLDLLPSNIDDWSPKNEVVALSGGGSFAINALNVVTLYVKDLSESLDFYCKFLGFKITREMKPGMLLYQDKADLTLYMETATEQQSPELAICFNSFKGVMKCLELLNENGVKIVQKYGSVDSGFAGVQFLDPSGNLLEIAGKP